MTPQEEQKFSALREMFNSQGWKIYQEDAEQDLKTFVESAPDACQTADQWQYYRGIIAQLRATVGYETYIKAVEKQAEEEDLDAEV